MLVSRTWEDPNNNMNIVPLCMKFTSLCTSYKFYHPPIHPFIPLSVYHIVTHESIDYFTSSSSPASSLPHRRTSIPVTILVCSDCTCTVEVAAVVAAAPAASHPDPIITLVVVVVSATDAVVALALVFIGPGAAKSPAPTSQRCTNNSVVPVVCCWWCCCSC